MSKEATTIEIEVSNEEVAREIAYGILGRAMDIHDNPDDDLEHVADELKEVANELREKFE